MTATNKHITLSELQQRIKESLFSEFRLPVWIVAEIGEMKVNYSSGHCYLELIEKGGANGVPRAKVSAVMWRTTYNMVAPYFKSATQQELTAGLKVLLKVSISYHELYGLSLQISDIDPSYTLGDQEQQRLQTIAALEQDGVLTLNHELPIATVVQRIAVISSATAAGYRDFMQEISGYGYAFHTELFGAIVQGAGAESSIIAALDAIAAREEEFDAVAIIRGGGAQSDLSCFNSYILCSNIAQFPLPIIAGIGHDKDQSVADLVAARSLKTPTAVAGWFVERATEYESRIDSAYKSITELSTKMIHSHQSRLSSATTQLTSGLSTLIRHIEVRLEHYTAEIRRHTDKRITSELMRMESALTAVTTNTTQRLERERYTLESATALITANDPKRILALGFAVVSRDGKSIRDSRTLKSGDKVEIKLHRGTKIAEIE